MGGFFKMPTRLPRNPKARAAFLAGQARQEAALAAAMGDLEAKKRLQEIKKMEASASAPLLATAGKQISGGGPSTPSQRSEKSFINDKARLKDQKRTMNPRQRYGRQLTAQHIH